MPEAVGSIIETGSQVPGKGVEGGSRNVRRCERAEAPRDMLPFLWAEDLFQYLVALSRCRVVALSLVVVAGAVLGAHGR